MAALSSCGLGITHVSSVLFCEVPTPPTPFGLHYIGALSATCGSVLERVQMTNLPGSRKS